VRDDERLLERCLREIESGGVTVEQCVERHLADQPDVAELLRAAIALRAVSPAPAEARAAHLRVGHLLTREMAAGPVRAPVAPARRGQSHTVRAVRDGSPWAGRAGRARRWVLASAAAVLLIGVLVGTGASTVAASALPGSPLYSLKRGEEWLALHTAWSDEREGQVLLTIASHRLDELRQLAVRNNAEALRLTSELDSTMRQAIHLAATMNAMGEDSGRIAAGLAHTLDIESETQRAAQANGQPDLARALQNATDGEQQAIHDQHLVLPDTNQPREQPALTPGTATEPAGHGGGKPGATPTPSAGAGNGNGNGNGGGNGGGNSNGAHPTPTPHR